MSRLRGLHSAALFAQASRYGDILSDLIRSATEAATLETRGELDCCAMIADDAATLRDWSARLAADERLNESVPAAAFLAGFRVTRTLEVMHASPVGATSLLMVGVEGSMVRHMVQLFSYFLSLLAPPAGLKA